MIILYDINFNSGMISKIGNAIKDNPEDENCYSESVNCKKKNLEKSSNNSTIINCVNKKEDVFYVPESNDKISPLLPKILHSDNGKKNSSTVTKVDNYLDENVKERVKFYSNNDDYPVIFNHLNKLKDHETQKNVSSIYKRNIFTPLGENSRDFFATRKSDNDLYENKKDRKVIENKMNKKKLTIFDNDKKINLKPVVNIFYSPDESSSSHLISSASKTNNNNNNNRNNYLLKK